MIHTVQDTELIALRLGAYEGFCRTVPQSAQTIGRIALRYSSRELQQNRSTWHAFLAYDVYHAGTRADAVSTRIIAATATATAIALKTPVGIAGTDIPTPTETEALHPSRVDFYTEEDMHSFVRSVAAVEHFITEE